MEDGKLIPYSKRAEAVLDLAESLALALSQDRAMVQVEDLKAAMEMLERRHQEKDEYFKEQDGRK